MVLRVGIGASAAAAVIFSILLASSILVFAASQDRERLYSVSNAEDTLGGEAAALMGAGGMNILLGAQASLAARTLDCRSAQEAADAVVGNLSDFQRSGGVTVDSSARPAPDAAAPDNLSMVAPFNGSVLGDLDISISMTVTGSSPSGAVSLGKSEVHFVHLPVQVGRLEADCIDALDGIAQALASESPGNCTSETAGPLVLEASRGPSAEVAADGFGFGFGYSLIPGEECRVSLLVQVQQEEVEGPGGPFTVRLEGEGVASFGPQASAPPGGISWRTGP